ncbi:MAG: hypothetical protein LBE13_18575 [Bacteroidales bacterium]|nr:hypothetical protein [Bacteroidales bacterium]
MLKSGNREDKEKEEKTELQVTSLTKEVKIETQPFRKPRTVLPENMKVTSIKDTLEENAPTTASQNNIDANKQTIIQSQESNQTHVENETVTASENELDVSEQEQKQEQTQEQVQKQEQRQETSSMTLQEFWEEAIKEVSTPNTIMTQGLLLKQRPVETENLILEIEVPNELAKQEIKEVLPALTSCIQQKSGISYTIEVKVVKVVQEKSIDTSNPDEKFKLLCQENSKLIEFVQRLNLSISY